MALAQAGNLCRRSTMTGRTGDDYPEHVPQGCLHPTCCSPISPSQLPSPLCGNHTEPLSCRARCLCPACTVENGGHCPWGPSCSEATSAHILGVARVPPPGPGHYLHLQKNEFMCSMWPGERGRTLEYTGSFIRSWLPPPLRTFTTQGTGGAAGGPGSKP